MAYNQSSSDEFGSILSSISSSHIEQAASPRPPSGGHRSPSGHERHFSSASSSYASHHSPNNSNYDLSYAQGSSSSNGAGPSGGWGGDGSFASSGFGRDSSGSGVGPTDQQSYRQHHHHQPTASASSSVSYGGGAFDEASFLAQFSQGGQPGTSGPTGGGRPAGEDSFSPRASSSASRPPSFVLNDHQQTSNVSQQDQSGQSSSGGDQGGPASFESWQHLIQPQPQHPLPPSNPFDFNAQPLPAFNFTTTHPPSGSNSPAVPDWANGNFTGNPSLLHRSSHSPSLSFDGHDDGSFRSRSSSYAGSSHGPPSDAGDPDQPPSFNFTPAAVDEAMRGLTFEDLALIAAAGGSPLPTSHHSSPSFSQHNNDPRSSSPYNPASPAQAQSHHSPFAHSIRSNPSPPQFNVAYSPASNPTSPSPPTAGLESRGPGKTMSPPTLVIPPDPTEASMMMTSPTETKPTSASSLFPPVDPRMVGVMRLATEGAGGPGGPQINIVPSTPTSGQLTGQPFSQHLAELNRRHQELLQKQQQQQQNSSQPPLHSLDTSSPRPSFGGFPVNGQQQQQQPLHNAPALTQQQQQAAYAASQAQQAQFVAMMSLVGMQQQMAQQQLAQQYQQQQQQQTGGQAANGGSNAVPDPMAAWMASLAHMGQQQQQQGQAGSQQYGHHQRAESFSHHHQPHQSSSYQPFDFINPDHQQQQQQQPPNQHHDIFPPLPYLSQPSTQQPNPVSRQLKAPPIRQRSRSEASLIPYDFGPSPPQAPTMDPSLLPGSSSNPNASFFPPLSSPNISFSADPTSLSDDGTVSHQGSLPSPSTFSFPFFVAPVRKATDDSMRGLGDLDGPGLGTMGTGGGSSEASHPRRSSFGGGQRAFGPGTPEYGRRLLNPWGRGGGGEDGDDGSDVGVRRSSSDAGSKRKGHRKVSLDTACLVRLRPFGP